MNRRPRPVRSSLPVRVLIALLSVGACAACNESASSADVGPCRDGDRDKERYGTSCLCCHAEFGVAGSVARKSGVVWIKIRDDEGKIAEMAPNPHDNFFRHRKLTPPLRATIVMADGTEREMKGPSPHGSCNACHGVSVPPLGDR